MADEDDKNEDEDKESDGFKIDPEAIKKAFEESGKKVDEAQKAADGEGDAGGEKKDGDKDKDKKEKSPADEARDKSHAHANDDWDPDVLPLPDIPMSEDERAERRAAADDYDALITRRTKKLRALNDEQLKAILDALLRIDLHGDIDKTDKNNPKIIINRPGGQVRIDQTGIYGSKPPTEDEIKVMIKAVVAMHDLYNDGFDVNLNLPDTAIYKLWCAAEKNKLTITNLSKESIARYGKMRDEQIAKSKDRAGQENPATAQAPAEQVDAEPEAAAQPAAGPETYGRRYSGLYGVKRDNVRAADFLVDPQENGRQRAARMLDTAMHYETMVDNLRKAVMAADLLNDPVARQAALLAAAKAFFKGHNGFSKGYQVTPDPLAKGVVLKAPLGNERAERIAANVSPIVQRSVRALNYYKNMATDFSRAVEIAAADPDKAASATAIHAAADALFLKHAEVMGSMMSPAPAQDRGPQRGNRTNGPGPTSGLSA